MKTSGIADKDSVSKEIKHKYIQPDILLNESA